VMGNFMLSFCACRRLNEASLFDTEFKNGYLHCS
jgi:hypothetical protein